MGSRREWGDKRGSLKVRCEVERFAFCFQRFSERVTAADSHILTIGEGYRIHKQIVCHYVPLSRRFGTILECQNLTLGVSMQPCTA